MVALVALVFSVIEAPTYGWLAARTVAGLAIAVVLVIAFVIWELRQAHPLLDPRVFRERALTAGTTSILIQFFAFYGYTFIILQYLQLVRGATPLLAALEVLPMAATMMPTSRLAPRLAARFGSRWVCAGGLVLVAAGLAIVAQLDTASSYWLLAAGLVVLGVGMGAAMTPATTAITEALPPARQGVGSALNDLSREVGGAIGIAVIGSILTSTYSSHVDVTRTVQPGRGQGQGVVRDRRPPAGADPGPGARGVRDRDEHRTAHGGGRRTDRGGDRGRAAADPAPLRSRGGAGRAPAAGPRGQPVASRSTAASLATAAVNACSGGLA